MFQIFLFISFLIFNFILLASTATAVSDPLAVPNNKFGIHIIQAAPGESSPAASLVNSSGGDWGYITFLIQSSDRNQNKWQEFFNDLRRRHLTPIVRIATKPVNAHWERPYEGEEEAWADFLDRLNWPIKNRYVVVYNEPNHASEWGLAADAGSYAKVLDKTMTALKKKSDDFFVMNAGFDASAPQKPPDYMDQFTFMQKMEEEVPGIFQKLDGWVSHSYPNPGFVGSPDDIGRGTIGTYAWELKVLEGFGVTKKLPVFITETGWKHAEGIKFDPSLPTSEEVAVNFDQAFKTAWNNHKIAAVTPFLLTYQEAPFDHFSFKKITGDEQNIKILGIEYPEYYPQYESIMGITKTKGKPIQENKAQLMKGEVFSSLVAGQTYRIPLTFKNTGQSIWNDLGQIRLRAVEAGEATVEEVVLPPEVKVEPGQEHTFDLVVKAPAAASSPQKIVLNLYTEDQPFDSQALVYTAEVKSPVILAVSATIKWKKDASGSYILSDYNPLGTNAIQLNLNPSGKSGHIEAKYLLPGYTYNFNLEKPHYKSKTIKMKVVSGMNVLDFGELQPDILSVLSNLSALWKLLPFSK